MMINRQELKDALVAAKDSYFLEVDSYLAKEFQSYVARVETDLARYPNVDMINLPRVGAERYVSVALAFVEATSLENLAELDKLIYRASNALRKNDLYRGALSSLVLSLMYEWDEAFSSEQKSTEWAAKAVFSYIPLMENRKISHLIVDSFHPELDDQSDRLMLLGEIIRLYSEGSSFYMEDARANMLTIFRSDSHVSDSFLDYRIQETHVEKLEEETELYAQVISEYWRGVNEELNQQYSFQNWCEEYLEAMERIANVADVDFVRPVADYEVRAIISLQVEGQEFEGEILTTVEGETMYDAIEKVGRGDIYISYAEEQ